MRRPFGSTSATAFLTTKPLTRRKPGGHVNKVLLFLAALLIGLSVGKIRGGRVLTLGDMKLRARTVVLAAIAVQVLLGIMSSRTQPPLALRICLVLLSELAVGYFLVRNMPGRPYAFRVALVITALGWLSNIVIIALIGRMPVSADALHAAGMSTIGVSVGHLGKHELANPHSPFHDLLWMGDSIGIRYVAEVISPGDVLMSLGLALLIYLGMQGDYRSVTHSQQRWDGQAPGLS